jgi:galactose-1-phosphate uridylyltransferase
MSIWQKIVAFFQKAWVKVLLKFVTDKLKEILIKVGEDAIGKIKDKIIAEAGTSKSGTEKLKAVVKYVKELVPTLPDAAINFLIESLVNQLKDAEEI